MEEVAGSESRPLPSAMGGAAALVPAASSRLRAHQGPLQAPSRVLVSEKGRERPQGFMGYGQTLSEKLMPRKKEGRFVYRASLVELFVIGV